VFQFKQWQFVWETVQREDFKSFCCFDWRMPEESEANSCTWPERFVWTIHLWLIHDWQHEQEISSDYVGRKKRRGQFETALNRLHVQRTTSHRLLCCSTCLLMLCYIILCHFTLVCYVASLKWYLIFVTLCCYFLCIRRIFYVFFVLVLCHLDC